MGVSPLKTSNEKLHCGYPAEIPQSKQGTLRKRRVPSVFFRSAAARRSQRKNDLTNGGKPAIMKLKSGDRNGCRSLMSYRSERSPETVSRLSAADGLLHSLAVAPQRVNRQGERRDAAQISDHRNRDKYRLLSGRFPARASTIPSSPLSQESGNRLFPWPSEGGGSPQE